MSERNTSEDSDFKKLDIKVQLIDKNIVALTTIVDSFKTNIDNLTSIIVDLKEIVHSHTTDIQLLEYRMDEFHTSDIGQNVTIRKIQDQIDTKFENLKTYMDDRFKKLDERVGSNEKWKNSIMIGAVVLYFVIERMGIIDNILQNI